MTNKLVILLITLIKLSAAKIDSSLIRSIHSFKGCVGRPYPNLCFKERALDVLNETILSDRPLIFYNMVEIERNPRYNLNGVDNLDLPQDIESRSSKLSDILYRTVEEFFKSRVIKFNMASAFEEGRRLNRNRNGVMMVAMAAMACMMGQMFMGKIAFLAGSALIIAKVALFLSAIVGLKKLSGGGGGGGGETQHVVYASSGDYGHGAGGGGWHRSLDGPHSLAYNAHESNGKRKQEDISGY